MLDLHAAFPKSFGPGMESAVLRMLGAHRACAAGGLVRQQKQGRMHLGQEAAGASRMLGRAHSAKQGSCTGLNRKKGFANSGVTRAKHMN